ncbi:MAG TPA: EamA family transporter RarD, partial [Microlunatus sp.]|nr:EamA family transporter RarD [Microlunatus sp.]
GRPPWVALVLAVTFALYGLLKKKIDAGAVETLTIESAYLIPLALGYLIFLQATGALTFGRLGLGHSLLLIASGPITALPLLLFAGAATRVPLSTLGLLQYVAPTLQFLLGVAYFGEQMSPSRWVGFGLVWLALMLLTGHILIRTRRNPTVTRESAIRD